MKYCYIKFNPSAFDVKNNCFVKHLDPIKTHIGMYGYDTKCKSTQIHVFIGKFDLLNQFVFLFAIQLQLEFQRERKHV